MKILIFDPEHRGHHAGYILNLLRSLSEVRNPLISLQLVVSEAFHDTHSDVVQFANENFPEIEWTLLGKEEVEQILEPPSPFLRGLREARVLQRESARSQPDRILCMYLDYLLFPIALGFFRRKHISGIVFRQNPHYESLFESKLSLRESLKSKVRGYILRKALHNPGLQGCLCLDRYLPDWMEDLGSRRKMYHCPDPVYIPPEADNRAAQAEGRKTLLLFGIVSERKGACRFLDALNGIDSHHLEKIRIRIVGPTGEAMEELRLSSLTSELEEKGCQIERINRFIQDEEIQPFFHACDAVVAPYLNHLGMSAIQVRAAAAKKPLLSSDFGLMGKLAQDRDLGLTFNTEDPNSITFALFKFLSGQVPFDPVSAEKFAQENAPKAFGDCIGRVMGIPSEAVQPASSEGAAIKPCTSTAE